MDDTLFYVCLVALLIGVILAAFHGINEPACGGSCAQGRQQCDCKEKA